MKVSETLVWLGWVVFECWNDKHNESSPHNRQYFCPKTLNPIHMWINFYNSQIFELFTAFAEVGEVKLVASILERIGVFWVEWIGSWNKNWFRKCRKGLKNVLFTLNALGVVSRKEKRGSSKKYWGRKSDLDWKRSIRNLVTFNVLDEA